MRFSVALACTLAAFGFLVATNRPDGQPSRHAATPKATAVALRAVTTAPVAAPSTAPTAPPPTDPPSTDRSVQTMVQQASGTRPVSVNTPGFWSWALLDRAVGEISGSPNLGTPQTTASMIKAWLAADYLRRSTERGQQPSTATLHLLSTMIRDSDNAAAAWTYAAVGRGASIGRMVSLCGLTDSQAGGDWSHTLMSARDAVRMGQCIADGRGAGAQWTQWVLTEMRNVRGAGRFGIITALPPAVATQTAIKNGWVPRSDGKWHVNCLAVTPGWALAVEVVYPASRGMAHGAAVCTSVARQLLV